MKIDTSSYYPETPGSSCEPGHDYDPAHRDFIPSSERHDTLAPEEPETSAPQPAPESPREESPREESEPERAVSTVSHILSWVLVPLLMPFYGTLIIFNSSVLSLIGGSAKLVFSLIVLGFTAVIPMLLVLVLKRLRLIDDIGLNGRKERLYPYIISILALAATCCFFLMKNSPVWMAMFFAGGAVGGLINLIVNFRWKISAHAAGAAGIVALIIHLSQLGFPGVSILPMLITAVALTGLLGSARVWMGRHTVMQVLAGYLSGFLSVYLMMFIQ